MKIGLTSLAKSGGDVKHVGDNGLVDGDEPSLEVCKNVLRVWRSSLYNGCSYTKKSLP
jgi:hypothetical protein